MEDHFVELIYSIPIIVLFVARLIWWLFFSKEKDELLPVPSSSTSVKYDLIMAGIVFWPVTLFFLSIVGVGYLVCYPFIWFRNKRLLK